MSHFNAVIGLGFGDEGKGHVVDYLSSILPNSTVLRFSGGPQAGHQVITDSKVSHVFSHFGSGTLQGSPTIWTRYCPTNPIAFMNEYDDLKRKGINPTIAIMGGSPIITPYEIRWNKEFQDKQSSSCEKGIFATYQREKDQHSIIFQDLYYPSVLRHKLSLLAEYYTFTIAPDLLEMFYMACKEIIQVTVPTINNSLLQDAIFEGSQGLLLDQTFGFFPYVTPANTGLTNILDSTELTPKEITTWLVTRAYQTRHGNGPMSPIHSNKIKPNPYEQNMDTGSQGKFRTTLLDLELLKYAYNLDVLPQTKRNVVITCLDLMTEDYSLQANGKIINCKNKTQFIETIQKTLKTSNIYISESPQTNGIYKARL